MVFWFPNWVLFCCLGFHLNIFVQVENAQNCLGRAIHLEPDTGYSKFLSLAQIMTGGCFLVLHFLEN